MPNIDASAGRRSLKERLRAAETEREIEELLREGGGYEFAGRRTRNAWRNAAQKRRKGLR